MGEFTQKVSIPKMLEAAGVSFIRRVNPLDLASAIQAVQEAASVRGVSAVIFESPCVALIKPETVHMWILRPALAAVDACGNWVARR